MYCGVPSSAASCVSTVFDPRIFEMPKSSTLTTSRTSPPRSVGQRKTLSGFRSRWTIALAVRGGQRRADLGDDRLHLLERQRPAQQARRQRLALQQLEHDVRRAVGQRVEVQHLDDVRVPEPRADLRLAPEARQHDRVGGAEQQHLDDHALARQAQVLRLPDRAHAALAEQPRDLVGLRDRRRQAGGPRRLPGHAARRDRPAVRVGALRCDGRIQGRIQRAGRHCGEPIIEADRADPACPRSGVSAGR